MSHGERTLCRPEAPQHTDAVALVELLMESGGYMTDSNPEIAMRLGFTTRRGQLMDIDMGRFYRARNHVRDRVDHDNRPCCGYQLHYRNVKGREVFALIDPSGDLGEHAYAAVGQLRGWMTRERQHQTENNRQVRTLAELGTHALSRGDKDGYRLCVMGTIDLEEHGTIRPTTMAAMAVWVSSL